jgi:hypothetical protein
MCVIRCCLSFKNTIMKINKCKWFGHKWIPVFIKGTYNDLETKFISCYCERCGKGFKEVTQINNLAKNSKYGTYSEKYFDKE